MTIEFLYAKIRNGSEFEILEHAGFWSYHILRWRPLSSHTLPQTHSCPPALFTVPPSHRLPYFLFLDIVEAKVFFSCVLFLNVLSKAGFSVICFDLVPLNFFLFSHSCRLVLSAWSFVLFFVFWKGEGFLSSLCLCLLRLFPWAVYWGVTLPAF